MSEHRTTAISGSHDLTGDPVPREPADSAGLIRTARAVVRLARAHRRLEHLPTVGQVRAMAWFDGREPCSYLLDRAVNFVPEPMEFGYERELGQHALAFACQDADGRAMELVTMRDGGGFDLLGI